MSKPQKKTFAKVMTPPGVLVFPKLVAPDEYKGKKSYSAKIRLSAEDSEVLIERIEAELKAYWPIAKAEYETKIAEAKTGKQKAEAKKALEEMAEAEKSYKPAYDDDGNETGEYEFNFKMPDHFISTKDKKMVYLKPDLFDAKGNLLKNPPEIWGGTTACVAGELRPYNMPIGVGISLRLKAVQIIELRSAGSGGDRSASGYGFGAREDGYEADGEATNGGFEDRTGDRDSGIPDPDDF
jgi:hypothetical protein